MAKPNEPPQILTDTYKEFTEDKAAHQTFVQKVEQRLRVYHGILEPNSDAASWTNKLTPRYAFQIIEMMVAGMVDPDPNWRLKARPRLADPEELAYYREGARMHEILLSHQADIDHFAEKQRAFALQGLIAGLTVGKSHWRFREEEVTRYQPLPQEPVVDDYGNVVGLTEQTWGDVPKLEVVHDDPTFEVCDVRDTIWHQGAVSLDRSLRFHHRLWLTFDELKRNECQTANGRMHTGPCRNGLYHNVDDLKNDHGNTGDLKNRDAIPGQGAENKAKDLYEIVDSWVEHGRRNVIFGGNGKVLLADRPNPYFHQTFPFVVGSSNPGLFTIPGTSEIELAADAQTVIWSILNQSLDGLQLVNNPIFWFSPEIEDYNDFEFYPGARWPGRPDQITAWEPPQIPFEAAMRMMGMVKDDLQNITGAVPTLLGVADPSAQTATEVSLVANFAQRRVLMKKQHLMTMPMKRVGEQWIDLNQQFIRANRVVELTGPGGVKYAEEIDPRKIQGRYYIDVESMDASLSRRERQAEAQSKLQVVAGTVQIFAALKQADPTVRMPNFEALVNDVYENLGISDTERYWQKPAPPPQMQAAAAQGPPGQGGQPPADPQGGPGLTSPMASDQLSPSNVASLSPVAPDQRMLAMNGGPTNVG